MRLPIAAFLWVIVTCSDFFLLIDAARSPKYLVYPPPGDGAPTKVQLIFGLGLPMEIDVSTIIGYVMKCNYNLPYNASYLTAPYVRRQRSASLAVNEGTGGGAAEAGRAKPRRVEPAGSGLGRYEIYKMLESAIESGFRSGRACLLRAICELAATPLNARDGLLAQLLHIFLTPSSSAEQYRKPIDQEYLAAESIGRRLESRCDRTFSECDTNFLDYFTKIH